MTQQQTPLEHLGGELIWYSDMAPNTTGSRLTDHVRQIELAMALQTALRTLRMEDVVKVSDGEMPMIRYKHSSTLRNNRRVKPKVTRNESVDFLSLDFDVVL